MLHFLTDKKRKKTRHIFIHIMFVTFFLIFKFILIYLLHVLFVLKIEGIVGKRKISPKEMKKGVIFFIYSINKFNWDQPESFSI